MTQTETILKALLDAEGGWVSMPDLWKASGAFAVHSRAADIRKLGHTVENRIEEDADGVKLSWYRIPKNYIPAKMEQAALAL